MGKPTLEIRPEWRDALARAGLDSFGALMAYEGGRCCSRHTRGQTYRVELPGGEVVFLKRDAFTMVKHILGDLLRFRRPQPLTCKERWANGRVAALGIAAPEAVAWGQRRRMGLPHQAVIVSTALPGTDLGEYLPRTAAEAARHAVLAAAGSAVAKLYEADLSWPDLLPKHIVVSDDRAIGLLDLERMRPCRNALVRCMPAQVRRFCRRLQGCGASEAEVDVFLDALGYEDLVDYEGPQER